MIDTVDGGGGENAASEGLGGAGADNFTPGGTEDELFDTPPHSPAIASPHSPNRHGLGITATPPRPPTGIQEKGGSPRHDKRGEGASVSGMGKDGAGGNVVEDASEVRYGHETNLNVFVTEVTDDEEVAAPPASTVHASDHSSNHSVDDNRVPPVHRFVLGDDIPHEDGGGDDSVSNDFDLSIGASSAPTPKPLLTFTTLLPLCPIVNIQKHAYMHNTTPVAMNAPRGSKSAQACSLTSQTS